MSLRMVFLPDYHVFVVQPPVLEWPRGETFAAILRLMRLWQSDSL